MAKPNENYDLKEAGWKFVALKGIEVLLILFVIYGFYFLGLWINGFNGKGDCGLGFNWTCPYTNSQDSMAIWGIGLLICGEIICALILWFIILLIAALIIWLIIIANWGWAKRWAETPQGKKKRLRKKYGFVNGDKVMVEKGLLIGEYYDDIKFVKRMKKYEGKTTIIDKMIIDDEGDHYFKLNIDKGKFKWTPSMLERWNLKK